MIDGILLPYPEFVPPVPVPAWSRLNQFDEPAFSNGFIENDSRHCLYNVETSRISVFFAGFLESK